MAGTYDRKRPLVRGIYEVVGFLLVSLVIIIKSLIRQAMPLKYKMKDVAGEIVLITGGGGGLGRLMAIKLANLGAIVVVWDINAQGVKETVETTKSLGGTCYGYVCDLCNREDVYKKAAQLTKEVGRVSILINNAGVVNARRFLETTDAELTRTMDVNIMSHFWTVKAFLPAMLKENKGHIVSIASLAGHVGCPKLVDYTASKFAAVGFDEALRLELADDGYDIKTTVICPYFIRSTGMFEDVMARYINTLSPDEVAERVITAMRCNEKYAIIPSYLQVLLAAKWMFPAKCAEMLMRGLVHDVSPKQGPAAKFDHSSSITTKLEDTKEQSNGIHQQLTRRSSNSERKP